MSDAEQVGDAVARYFAQIGVTTVFGVISIHNMPLLDAISRHGLMRFVPARGEAGAMNMADAYARVSRSLGVVITSTGTAAGNAAGAQVEALVAGTPLLHITTQVDREFMDRDRAAIHDVPRQPDMLRAISKSVYRLLDTDQVEHRLYEACSDALTAPTGPVSIEIPVDVQRLTCRMSRTPALPSPTVVKASDNAIQRLAETVSNASRPMIWLGGGARDACPEARELVNRGFCVVTSTNGRGIVEEHQSVTLGAFNMTAEASDIYARSDLMIVAGSRLRGNETRNNTMKLPSPLVQIDCDSTQENRNYPVDLFVHGDTKNSLARLLESLPEKLDVDDSFRHEIAIARAKSEGVLRETLGPYQIIADSLMSAVPAGQHPFVRDVTIANSTFGNRYVHIAEPHHGVHALGGGIGQGIAMGIGAALVQGEKKVIGLLGDGGAQLGISELITAVEEHADIVYILMNDQSYGVIRNIQDAQYESRHAYSSLATPDFALLCKSINMPHRCVNVIEDFDEVLQKQLEREGPSVLEVDMLAIGPYATPFGGPPAGAAGKSPGK